MESENGEAASVKKKQRKTKNKGSLSYGKKRRKLKGTGTYGIVKTSLTKHEIASKKEGQAPAPKKRKLISDFESDLDFQHADKTYVPLPANQNLPLASETGLDEIAAENISQVVDNEENFPCGANAEGQNLTDSEILEAYFKTCVEAIQDQTILDMLVRKLHETDTLDDFIILLTSLATGMFDTQNIAFLLCLERCKFESLKSTTQMRYRPQTKLFWKLLYKETSGKAVRMASGPKSKGAIVQHGAQRGCYDPKDAQSNFAVPDVRSLTLNHETFLPRTIQPGIITAAIDMLPTDKDIVLLGDGKGLARGQLPGGRGDVDMFGHEEPPTHAQLNTMLQDAETAVKRLENDDPIPDTSSLFGVCEELSKMMQRLQERSLHFGKRRQGMISRFSKDRNRKKYEYGMSWVNAMDYKIRMALEDLVQLNGKIASLVSYLNRAQSDFNSCSVLDISNLRRLRKPEKLAKYDLQSATELVKPGTEMWRELRREAYVTTDNIFQAIGLSGIAAMKKHYNFVIEKKIEEDEVKVPSVATLGIVASKVLPVVWADAVLEESGVYFRDTEMTSRFIACSPHSIMRRKGLIIPIIIREEQQNSPNLYTLDEQILCRAVCDMLVLDATEAMLITLVPGRVFVQMIEGFKDSELAIKIVDVAVKIYEHDETENIQLPKAAEMTWKEEIYDGLNQLRQHLDNTRSVLAFPCDRFCEKEIPDRADEDEHVGPFMISSPKVIRDISPAVVEKSLNEILEVCNEHLTSAHSLLRPQADEIFAIMATDTDRKSTSAPAQVPVAYGLKGGGLSTKMLRGMMDEVKDELHGRGLNVVCEIYDGYHHAYMERDASGQPLYQTKLQQDTWKMFSELGKKKLVEKVEELSSVSSALTTVASSKKLRSASLCEGNLVVVHTKEFPCPKKKRDHGIMIVTCNGGPLNTTGVMEKVHSSTGNWFTTPKPTLDFSAITIADVLLPDSDLLDTTFEYDSDAHEYINSVVCSVLLHECPEFLQKLTRAIQEKNRKKWKLLTPDFLLKKYLMIADAMVKPFTVKELDTISDHVEEASSQRLFPKNCKTKARKSSVIAMFFGGDGSVSTMRLNPLPLLDLCKISINETQYPAQQLKVALAEVYHYYRKKEWLDRAPVCMDVQVDGEGNTLQLFSYPEFSQGRQKLEPKVTDPYHILTNLRKGSTTGNYEKMCQVDGVGANQQLCKSKAWRKVVQRDNKLLTYSILDCVDKQSGHLARRVFSEQVQEILSEEGEEQTAEFVFHVRNFSEACDQRGLFADERVSKLVGIHRYLTSGVDFNAFPPPGLRVKGIPLVTYEAILANISTRIQLYSIVTSSTYNHRAISSLACENFFSTLDSTSPTGSPRATDIPRTISQIVNLNHYRHLSSDELGFFFTTTANATYDVHTLDSQEKDTVQDGEEDCDTFWKNHYFDKKRSAKNKSKYHKGSFTHDLKPLRGVQPIRAKYYKIDEQRLNSLKRMGVDSADLLRFGIPLEWQL